MPYTYEPISTVTLGSSTSSIVTFTSIPGTYTDLLITMEITITGGTGNSIYAYFNSDTSANSYATFSYMYAYGTSSTPATTISLSTTNGNGVGIGAWQGYSSSRMFGKIYIPQYTNTFSHKQVISHFGDVDYNLDYIASIWKSTSAITSIDLRNTGGSPQAMDSGTKATIWGITKA